MTVSFWDCMNDLNMNILPFFLEKTNLQPGSFGSLHDILIKSIDECHKRTHTEYLKWTMKKF